MRKILETEIEAPILGIARGKFLDFQHETLKAVAQSNGFEMTIVDYINGTDNLIFYVIESQCKSVCFLHPGIISKTFLFMLRVIHDIHIAGIDIYVVVDLGDSSAFKRLDKTVYSQLWDDFRGEWEVLHATGASWWKIYKPPPDL